MQATQPSRSKINSCGALLRDHFGGAEVDWSDYAEAIDVLTDFRNSHGYPMTKVRLGLASFARTAGVDAAITQRHKRVPRIIRKLHRYPTTMLARLEDIAGCRAVVPTGDDALRLADHLRNRWKDEIVRERDYVASPKDLGYRALHIVTKRDQRAVEIQIRTRGQQRWAESIEAIDARRGLNLKDGSGPPALVEYFTAAGEFVYRNEYGLPVDEDLLKRFDLATGWVIAEGYYTGR